MSLLGNSNSTSGDNDNLTTKGDIVSFGSAEETLQVGTNGQVLSADSSESSGLKWIANAPSNPITTKGDLFTYDTGDQRLAAGTNGQVLSADSGESTGLKWVTSGSAPTTTKGDISTYDTAQQRLAVGTNGQILTADSGEATGIKWAAATSAPTTTKGDISTYDTAQQRLAVGTNGQILTADSGEATGIKWAAATSAPTTTKGDLSVYDTSQARLPVGTDGQILVSEAIEDTGLKWVDNITAWDNKEVSVGSTLWADKWDSNDREITTTGTVDPYDSEVKYRGNSGGSLHMNASGYEGTLKLQGTTVRHYINIETMLNVEVTGSYYRYDDGTYPTAAWSGLNFGFRSGIDGHTVGGENDAHTYYCRVRHDDTIDIYREVIHNGTSSTLASTSFDWNEQQWYTFKFRVYDIPAKRVTRIEIYVDDVLKLSYEDYHANFYNQPGVIMIRNTDIDNDCYELYKDVTIKQIDMVDSANIYATNTGYTGVGINVPTYPLHVYQNTTSTTSPVLALENGSSGDVSIRFITNEAAGKYVMGIDRSDGNKFKIANDDDSLTTNTRMTFYSQKIGISEDTPAAKLHINQSSATGSVPCLILEQQDIDKHCIEFTGTESANVTDTISTLSTPGSITKWIKMEVNGSVFWLPAYTNPS